jgi:chemotaxis protein histidine kinase CheA
MSRIPANLQERWIKIGQLKFAEQAIWVLNGFWVDLQKEAENIWGFVQGFKHFDKEVQMTEKKSEATDLDEFWSHKFLESLGQTMTVIEMRERFRQIDADFNKRMSVIEYLIFRYKLDITAVINAPQGENKEEIARAQAMVDQAQRAVEDMTATLEASRKATAQAKAAAEDAKKAAEAAWFAEQENKKALEELQKQEKAFQDKKADLEKTKQDSSLGLVKRNQASAQLSALLAEDPLPLRKAKINQAATVKKSEKARAAADAAKAKADADAVKAAHAEKAAEASVAQAEKMLQDALDFLDKAKRSGTGGQGQIWWLQREIIEKKKYLPASKQK